MFSAGLCIAAGLCAALLPPIYGLVILFCVVCILLAIVAPLAALAVLLILAPLRTLIATEADLRLPLDIGQMFFILFATVSFMHSTAFRRPLVAGWSPLYLPAGVFLAITAMTGIRAFSLTAWLLEWIKWVLIATTMILTAQLAQDRRWQWAVFGLVMSGAANALVGIYIFFGGSGATHLLISDGFFRAFGTFGQPNPFGGFMGLLSPVVLMMAFAHGLMALRLWRTHHQINRVHLAAALFYMLAGILLVVGVLISWSRGAWLSFAVSMAALVAAFPRNWRHSAVLVAAAVAFAIGTWNAGLVPVSIKARIQSAAQDFAGFKDMRGVDITTENYASVERLAHWQAALNMVRANPWLGVGFGNYATVYEDYRLINWAEPLGHAHNYYLNVLAETGIIGLLAYMSLWLSALCITWRTRSHPDMFARAMSVGLFGSWCYLLTHSLTDNLYVNNMFLHLGALLGILTVLYNQTKSQFRLTQWTHLS